MSVAIEVERLRRSFVLRRRVEGRRLRRERFEVQAVDDVSFTIPAGQLVGYIGPNGAGKSTTVKILSGILVPTSGQVRVAGMDPSRARLALARRIGVVFGQRTTLWWDLPLRESFALLRHVYEVDAGRHRTNLERFSELLELGPFLDTPVRQLSLGQRMRGDLCAALLHDPEVLFLDEPTIGLDVVSKLRVREFLATHNAETGTTVVLTTHDLADIERLSQRVLVIDHGRVVHDGTVEQLKAVYGTERSVVVDLATPAPPIDLPHVVVESVEGARQHLRFKVEDIGPADLVRQLTERFDVADLTLAGVDIEEVVRRIYDRS